MDEVKAITDNDEGQLVGEFRFLFVVGVGGYRHHKEEEIAKKSTISNLIHRSRPFTTIYNITILRL